jgi:hypothetical protein
MLSFDSSAGIKLQMLKAFYLESWSLWQRFVLSSGKGEFLVRPEQTRAYLDLKSLK